MNRMIVLGLLATLALTGCKKKEQDKADDKPTPEINEPAKVQPPMIVGADTEALGPEGRADALVSGDVARSREVAVWLVLVNAAPTNDERDALVIIPGASSERPTNKSFILGISGIRNVVLMAASEKLGIPNLCGSECRVPFINALAKPIAGGDVYKEAGVLDPQVLKKFLDTVYVKPDTELLGVKASDVYPLLRPIVFEFVMMQRAIRVLGKEKVLEEFNEAREAAGPDPEGGINNEMLTFYRRFANQNNLGMLAGLESDRSHFMLGGFWMRRLADGTEPVLDAFFKVMLKDYDQKLLDESTRK